MAVAPHTRPSRPAPAGAPISANGGDGADRGARCDAGCTQPPTRASLARVALRRRVAGAGPLLRWSRRSAADVLLSAYRRVALIT